MGTDSSLLRSAPAGSRTFLLRPRREGDSDFWEAEAEVWGLAKRKCCQATALQSLLRGSVNLFCSFWWRMMSLLLQISSILAFPLMEGSKEPTARSRAGEKPVFSFRSPDLAFSFFFFFWKRSVPKAVHPPPSPLLLCFPAGNGSLVIPMFFISGWGLFGSSAERSQKNS